MTYTHHTETRVDLTLKIVSDECGADSPAEDDAGCVRFAMLHRRYANPAPELNDVEAVEDFERQSRRRGAEWIGFPVFMYEHSGVAFSLRPFSCPWDSGRVGTLFLKRSEFRKPYRRAAEQWLRYYNDWASGNVWGYVVEDEDGEHIDSCWGFIGDPDSDVLDEGRSALAYAAKDAETATARALEAERPDLYA